MDPETEPALAMDPVLESTTAMEPEPATRAVPELVPAAQSIPEPRQDYLIDRWSADPGPTLVLTLELSSPPVQSGYLPNSAR